MIELETIRIGLSLLLSHLVTDFIAQPNSWVAAKNTSGLKAWELYAHASLAGLLAALALWGRGGILVPLLIGTTHLAIDYGKIRWAQTSIAGLVLNQLLHLSVLTLAWLYVCPIVIPHATGFLSGTALPRLLVYICALALATQVGGIVIGTVTSKWRPALAETELSKGLERAGMWIGILERTLILIFVLIPNWEAIGFLITAKTILRFKEIQNNKDRKVAEYILIGTLISFLWAIFVGLAATWALAHLTYHWNS